MRTASERIRSGVSFARELMVKTPVDAINVFRLRALRALGRPALRHRLITLQPDAETYARGTEGCATWSGKRAAQVVDLIICCPEGFVVTAIMVGEQDMMFGGSTIPIRNLWPTTPARGGVRFVTLRAGEKFVVKFRNDSQIDTPLPFFGIAEIRVLEKWLDVHTVATHECWDGPGKLLPEERAKTWVCDVRWRLLKWFAGDESERPRA
jgi:hypothetical protein